MKNRWVKYNPQGVLRQDVLGVFPGSFDATLTGEAFEEAGGIRPRFKRFERVN